MKKTTLFYCDLYHTIFENEKQTERINEFQTFIKQLECIRKIEESEDIVISFATTAPKEVISTIENEIQSQIKKENIRFEIPCYLGETMTKLEKWDAIKRHIQNLSLKFQIQNIYYIDTLHKGEKTYIVQRDRSSKPKIISSIKNSIYGVNECLKEKIKILNHRE